MKNKYVVYRHTSPHGKVYIGITRQDIRKRWQGGMGYKDNPHFFSAIVKYGWDNFKHEILLEDLSEDEAYSKEKELIKEHKSNLYEFGYNRSSGGKHGNEGCHTKRTFKINNPRRGGDAPRAKPVVQFSINGERMNVWGCGADAAKHYHLKGSSPITNSCKFKQITAHGYIWLYENEAERINEKLDQLHKRSRRDPRKKCKTKNRLVMNGIR